MSKIDKTQLPEHHVPNSRSRKKVDQKNAQEALDFAKKNVSRVVFVKQGDGEFSRKSIFVKKKDPETENLYNVTEAADYLGLIHATFYSRSKVYQLPFTKISGRKYFSQETLDDHKKNTVFKNKITKTSK